MEPKDILSQHHLKRTSCREGIIEVIMHSEKALSEPEIRERLAGNYDRTTFYRSFKTLEESSIVHKIVVDNQLVKYALDISVTHNKKHAHFYCTRCNTVRCLNEVEVEMPQLPDGYSSTEIEVVIKGVCKNCRYKED